MYITTDESLDTNLHDYLLHVDGSQLFYKEYDTKHPIALHNVSLGKIDFAVSKFLDIYQEFSNILFEEVDKKYTGELLRAYKDVLYALREYLDDSFTIAKIFVKPEVKHKTERNQFMWLKINAFEESRVFLESLSEYKKYLDDTVNELKHNNGFLGGCSFYSLITGKHCLGYFVANISNDVSEPVEKIHPKFRNMYTGFSFRRDLHYNYYNVYFVSELLIDFIKSATGLSFEDMVSEKKEPTVKKKQLCEGLMSMHPIHFPDEYKRPVPSVALLRSNRLKLEYPSSFTVKPNLLEKAVLTTDTDGHTRAFRMLYM